ncbi:MAG: hypothetical protein CMI16_04815 [Opitutaceae bacterium]|nr:hypothetical protein [Opitutaceae bacterium]
MSTTANVAQLRDEANARNAAAIARFAEGALRGAAGYAPAEPKGERPMCTWFQEPVPSPNGLESILSASCEIPLSEIQRTADEERAFLFLKPWFVSIATNRERRLASFFLSNAVDLVKRMPFRFVRKEQDGTETSCFFEPGQILGALSVALPLDKSTSTTVSIPESTMREITPPRTRKATISAQYSLVDGELPRLQFADFSTGSGKTAMMILAALFRLVDTEVWQQTKSTFRASLASILNEPDSGLIEGADLGCYTLARLAVAIVPTNLVTHWKQHAEWVIEGFKDIYPGLEVELWVDTAYHSVKKARDSGKPTLCIMTTEKVQNFLRRDPMIAVPFRVDDELSEREGDRLRADRSPVLQYAIANATIERMRKATAGAPNHPLRRFFKGTPLFIPGVYSAMQHRNYTGKDSVSDHLKHYAKLLECLAAQWIRDAVSTSCRAKMPLGIKIAELRARGSNLAEVALDGLHRLTLVELAKCLMGASVTPEVAATVCEAIAAAESVAAPEMIDRLKQIVAGLPTITFSQNRSKAAVERLCGKLEECLGGTLECAISHEPIPPGRVRVMRCCTGALDADWLAEWRARSNRCPCCRAPLGDVAEIELGRAAPAVAGAKRKREESPELEAVVEEISQKRLGPDEAVLQLFEHCCAANPSFRGLLALSDGGMRALRSMMDGIVERIPGAKVVDLEQIAKSGTASHVAVRDFSDKVGCPQPHILLLSASGKMTTIQGLDLYATDLAVIAAHGAESTQRQLVGRVLRMHPKKQGWKRIVRLRVNGLGVGGTSRPPSPAASAAASGSE